jgi:hypothetical protein
MRSVRETDIKRIRGLVAVRPMSGISEGTEFTDLATGEITVFYEGIWHEKAEDVVLSHNTVWDPDIFDYVAETQSVVVTDELTVIADIPDKSDRELGVVSISSCNFIQSEEDAIYKYYGFASSTGWQIKRKTLATGIWKVASGEGDYDAAWADKENKIYGYV